MHYVYYCHILEIFINAIKKGNLTMNNSLTYADSGVDIDKANRLVDRIKDIAKSTPRSGVMGEIGGFGGLFSLNLSNVPNPVLE